MSNYSLREKEILDKLFYFFSMIEIKDKKEADKYETKNSSFNASMYISASFKNDSFLSYNYNYKDIMTALNCSEEYAINIIKENYKTINSSEKLQIQLYKRDDITKNYEELNDYYRELSGIPKQGETPLKISSGKYVTDLNDNELNFIYYDEIQTLIKKYPKKKYLKHLGSNSINPIIARTTRNFGILQHPDGIFQASEVKEIMDFYYENLGYVETVLYSKAFMHYEYYNSFIIFLLIVMTMQRFLVNQLDKSIKRDFIDDESMKNFFDSYNLPYWTNLPTKYKKRLIKNMNKLFMYKGTDKVIVDIVSLLGFENVEIFKHYLVKTIEEDRDGQEYIDLKFIGVGVGETNIPNAIKKSAIEESYDNLTMSDPFWCVEGNENELKQKLIDAEFNYISTKYMSINTIYNVTQLTTEVCYFFQLLNHLERENKLDLYFYSSDIKPNGAAIRLYDAIVAIYYLVCKKMNYVDNIITSTTAMASIFGFNFDTDIETLRSLLEQENLTLSSEYLKVYSSPPGLLKKKDIVDLYFNNITFKKSLEKAILECDDITTYKALKRVHSYNEYCENNKSQFKKSDGTYYSTYLDYLKDKDKTFGEYIEENSNNEEDLSKLLNNVFYALESFLDSDKFKFVFVGLSSLGSEIIKKYLKQLLEFFKSYTVEINRINSYFILDDKFNNTIHLISQIILKLNLDIGSIDRNFVDLFDDLYKQIKITDKDSLELDSFEMRYSKLNEKDKVIFKDLIHQIIKSSKTNNFMDIDDDISLRTIFHELEKISFEDVLNRTIDLVEKEDLNMQEKRFVYSIQQLIDRGLLIVEDVLAITNKISNKERFSIIDFVKYTKTHKIDIDLNLIERTVLNAEEKCVYKVLKDDTCDFNSNLKGLRSNLNLSEQVFIFRNRTSIKH